MNEELRHEIVRRHHSGTSIRRIAQDLGLARDTVQDVVRRWQAVQPTKEMYTVLNRQRLAAVAVPDPALTWGPAYSAVSGDLPTDAAPTFKWNQNAPLLSVVRFQLDVTTAGKVKLALNEAAGLTIWIDGNPVEPAASLALDLAAGVHTVTPL